MLIFFEVWAAVATVFAVYFFFRFRNADTAGRVLTYILMFKFGHSAIEIRDALESCNEDELEETI